MALYHKWDITFFSLLSDGLGSVFSSNPKWWVCKWKFRRISRTFQKLGNTSNKYVCKVYFRSFHSLISFSYACLTHHHLSKRSICWDVSLPKCIELWLIIMMECSFKKDITPWCCHSFVRDLTRLELDLKFMKLKMNKNEMWQWIHTVLHISINEKGYM